ncbi:sensor histidine kinase [Streptomyces sp. NPDC057702]|uniref:sensor histidine kinase n=1 Tax=unclassified Streptomyces TaxID=2593676 RepID=UPI00368BE6E1
MDRNSPRLLATTGLIAISSVAAFTLTWVVDIVVLARYAPAAAPTGWLPVLVTGPLIALIALGLPRSASLVARVVGAVALSLALTLWCLVTSADLKWWGALESCGLLFLAVRTTAGPWRPARATAHTLVLAVVVLMLPLRAGSWNAFVGGGYVLTVALSVCVAVGCAIRAQEGRRERAVHDVRQAERLALARDLHDLIAHHMTGIIVQAHAALTIQATSPEKVEPILRTIAGSGTETLESMRRLVRVLREDNHAALRPGDLLGELGDLVATHSAAGDGAADGTARLEVTAAARTATLSPEVEISVERLVREALTNVGRHAPGARATVRLDTDDAWLRVTVTNTAPTHRAAPPVGGRGGFGLLGLRERVEALDGSLSAGPFAHGGWRVEATFPLSTSADVRAGSR